MFVQLPHLQASMEFNLLPLFNLKTYRLTWEFLVMVTCDVGNAT